jgi:hypothetical protein
VGLGYQRMSGDTGFANINGTDGYLVNLVQINDFGNQDERSWQARYDYNFAAVGIPGLTFMTRYLSGDDVTVRNRHGEVDAMLIYDDTLRPGVVAMTHGWGQRSARGLDVARRNPGVNVNRLAPTGPDGYDPLSNQSQLTGINVEVARLRHP